jgi:uncharacterized membrane protein required for colicin V production
MKSVVDVLANLSFGWADVVIVVLLGVGLWRGRKRGMSEECLDILKWAIIVVAAAYFYEPGGRLLAKTSVFSLLACYVFAYFLIVALTFGVFAFIRNRVGAKIVGSEAFGGGEYYLGMAAGVFRYACIILVAMAFLNARYYTPEELAANEKYQLDNFGSSFFPTWSDIQRDVFRKSCVGRLAHEHLQVAFIRSTSPDGKGLGKETDIGRRRERSVYEVLDKKR